MIGLIHLEIKGAQKKILFLNWFRAHLYHKVLADAEKQQIVLEAEAEAEAIALKGEAEAYAVEVKAKAEAEQMAKKADAWKEYKQAALVDMMLKVSIKTGDLSIINYRLVHVILQFSQVLPEVAREVSTPMLNTKKITMVSSGDGPIGANRSNMSEMSILRPEIGLLSPILCSHWSIQK